jgi:hypothetical protein
MPTGCHTQKSLEQLVRFSLGDPGAKTLGGLYPRPEGRGYKPRFGKRRFVLYLKKSRLHGVAPEVVRTLDVIWIIA